MLWIIPDDPDPVLEDEEVSEDPYDPMCEAAD